VALMILSAGQDSQAGKENAAASDFYAG
jgi:hypothetical protein